MSKQRFLVDTEDTLYFWPPERQVASEAKVTLYYPGGGELQAQDTATVDSVSTTLTADADRKARAVEVTSATGISAGRRYLVTGNDGRVADVKVLRVDGTTLYLYNAIPFDLASASPFVGWELSYSLTTTHTDIKDENYRAEWEYTIGGVAIVKHDIYDVIGADEWYPTRIQDVLAEYHWLADVLHPEQLDGELLLEQAWLRHLRPMMRSKGIDPARVKDKYQLIGVHCALVNWIVVKNKGFPGSKSQEDRENAWADVEHQMALLESAYTWIDEDDDQAADDGEEKRNKRGRRLLR